MTKDGYIGKSETTHVCRVGIIVRKFTGRMNRQDQSMN